MAEQDPSADAIAKNLFVMTMSAAAAFIVYTCWVLMN